MAGYYDRLRDSLVITHEAVINAFAQAQDILNSEGVPPTSYREIYYFEGRIKRHSDDADITSLSQAQQLHYYGQLDQLFKLAYNNLIYTA